MLPVEYKPLTRHALTRCAPRCDMMLFEHRCEKPYETPVTFRISNASHDKTVQLLNDHIKADPITYDFLLPSELWGMARTLSAEFGRLNEAAIASTTHQILGNARPEELLTAQSRLVWTQYQVGGGRRPKLEFALIETKTSNEREELLSIQRDKILLFHTAPRGFYHDKEIPDTGETSHSLEREVYFRYEWDPTEWQNNVHTDEYAKKFGYERGLPEFITYLDTVFDAVARTRGITLPMTIDIPVILPVYQGDKIEVRVKGNDIRFVRDGNIRLRAKID